MIVRYIITAILTGLLVTLAFQSGLVALELWDSGVTFYVGPFQLSASFHPGTWFPGQYL